MLFEFRRLPILAGLLMAVGCNMIEGRRAVRMPPNPPLAGQKPPAPPPSAVRAGSEITPVSAPWSGPTPPAMHSTEPVSPPSSGPSSPPFSGSNTAASSKSWSLQLLDQAVAAYSQIDSYQARLRRCEQVGGRDAPEEVILFRFRKQPWSIYFKWIGSEGKGREAVYVKGSHDDKVHTLLAPSDRGLFLTGKTISLPPDSPLIRSKSRYSITEAGIGGLIDRFARVAGAADSALKQQGIVTRPDYAGDLECVEQTVAPGSELLLQGGGRRWWFFDVRSRLPVLVITHDAAGRQVEFYCYDHIHTNIGLDDNDFDPAVLWKGRR